MGHMICRGIKKENNKNNVVWFNSYGKEILNERQEIVIEQDVVGSLITRVGQRFVVYGTSISAQDIIFQNNAADVEKISFGANETKIVKGILSNSIDSISTIINNFSSLKVIFEEYAISKPYKQIIFGDLQEKDRFYNQRIYLSYDKNQQGLNDSLIQRLSVLKGELWYNVNQGLPLIEKIKSKHLIDASVLSIIADHPDVDKIISFSSRVENNKYRCGVEILSKFGQLSIII